MIDNRTYVRGWASVYILVPSQISFRQLHVASDYDVTDVTWHGLCQGNLQFLVFGHRIISPSTRKKKYICSFWNTENIPYTTVLSKSDTSSHIGPFKGVLIFRITKIWKSVWWWANKWVALNWNECGRKRPLPNSNRPNYRGVQIPGTKSPGRRNWARWRIRFVGPQCCICFMLPLRLEFWLGP